MKWKKVGLIYGPDGKSSWAKNSALQPTPILMENIIRVFVGFRDENGISRVGFVDVNAKNPSEIKNVSKHPILDVGEPGSFDSNGVVPTTVLIRDKLIYLYYAGYQIPNDVRFIAFGGLALSNDGGKTFNRFSKVPVMDRTNDELLFRVPHSIMYDNGIWKCWYGGGCKFIKGKSKTLPTYDIRYTESKDGINFNNKGIVCVSTRDDEYRVGRPFVIKDSGKFKMFYGYGSEKVTYKLGYAESEDGVEWKRKDATIGINLSKTGWDSKMMAYPSIIKYKSKTILFYNGNNYGYDGFGCAVLEKW